MRRLFISSLVVSLVPVVAQATQSYECQASFPGVDGTGNYELTLNGDVGDDYATASISDVLDPARASVNLKREGRTLFSGVPTFQEFRFQHIGDSVVYGLTPAQMGTAASLSIEHLLGQKEVHLRWYRDGAFVRFAMGRCKVEPVVVTRPDFCPSDFSFVTKGQFSYCARNGEVLGPQPADLSALCRQRGGGDPCDGTLWSERFFLNLRNSDKCATGSRLDTASGYCFDAQDNAYGPFPRRLIDRCLNDGMGSACRTNRWSGRILRNYLGLPHPQVGPQPLAVGGNVVGRLEATDLQNPTREGTFADDYKLTGLRAGQQVTVSMQSNNIDTYLQLLDGSGRVIAENDDFEGVSDSQLTFEAQAGQTYIVRATTQLPNVKGPYELRTAVEGSVESEFISIPVNRTSGNCPAEIQVYKMPLDAHSMRLTANVHEMVTSIRKLDGHFEDWRSVRFNATPVAQFASCRASTMGFQTPELPDVAFDVVFSRTSNGASDLMLRMRTRAENGLSDTSIWANQAIGVVHY